MTQIHEANDLE